MQDFLAILPVRGELASNPFLPFITRLEAVGLSVRQKSPKLVLATRSGAAGSEAPTRAIILGRAFGPRSADDEAPIAMDTDRVDRYLCDLVSRRWGSFAAVIANPGPGGAAVLRAPSGGPSIYYHLRDEIVTIATSVAYLEAVNATTFPVDRLGLAADLLFPSLRGRRTCLDGVAELLPGEALLIRDERATPCTIWSPARCVARRDDIRDVGEAAATIKFTVSNATKTLFDGCDRLLLNLSGGLDSSVLAAAGRGTTARLFGINLVSGPGSGDERLFAQAVADQEGFDLHIRPTLLEHVDVRRSGASSRPRPGSRSYTQALLTQSVDVAKSVGADAIVYGHGGDNVFCYLHSATPAADRLADGLNAQFWQSVRDVAAVTECSVPKIAYEAFRKRFTRRRDWRWTRDDTLLTGDILEISQAVAEHPWIAEMNDLPVGTRAHIAAIMIGFSYVDFLDNESEIQTLYPLLSQPVVETCLQIPTWLWYQGGVNRAPVRRAFASDLPRIVAHRSLKGGFGSFGRSVYLSNRLAIREMLLGGRLADLGILDRLALERALETRAPAGTTDYIRLLRLADVEAWLTNRASPPLRP